MSNVFQLIPESEIVLQILITFRVDLIATNVKEKVGKKFVCHKKVVLFGIVCLFALDSFFKFVTCEGEEEEAKSVHFEADLFPFFSELD